MNWWNRFLFWLEELADEIFGKPIEIPPTEMEKKLKEMRERIEASEQHKHLDQKEGEKK